MTEIAQIVLIVGSLIIGIVSIIQNDKDCQKFQDEIECEEDV